MRKKGFTLIELLAVIVILGVIALISVPVILNIIEDSRKGAFKTSVQSVFIAFETYKFQNGFSIDDKVSILDLPLTHKENFISGKVYKEGNTVKVEKVSNGAYCVSGTVENLQLIDGNCDLFDTTPPVINNVTSEVTTSGIKVYTTYTEEESFLSKHEYRIAQETENIEEKEWTRGDTLTGNLSTKSFTGLTLGTTYKIQVRLTNTGSENMVSEIKEILVTTLNIEKPVITLLTEREYATSKEIKLVYPEGTGLTYEYSLDGKNWISTNEKEKPLTIEENKRVRARVNDGTNYVYADDLMISGIDKTIPEITIEKGIIDGKNVLTAKVEPESTVSGYTYTWYKDGNIIEGENTSTLILTTSGTYKLKVMTGAGVESNEVSVETYMITYDLNGGTGSIENQVKIEDIDLTLTSVIPTKQGYHFVGWKESEDNVINYKGGDIYSQNKEVILSAIWSYYGTKMEDVYENIYVRNLTDGKLYSVLKTSSLDDYSSGNYDRSEGLFEIINVLEPTELNPEPYAINNKSLSIINDGENIYELTRTVSKNTWVSVFIRAGGGTTGIEISNLKLNFTDEKSLTLEEAISASYIEPLVIISSRSSSSEYIWQDILNIKNGGSSGIISFPDAYIVFKTTEKSILRGYRFKANHNFDFYRDGTWLREYKNIDLSIEP